MDRNDIILPEKSDELVELESRFSRIRQQSQETARKLQAVETTIARRNMSEGDDLNEIAAKLASGEVDDFKHDDLPLQRHDLQQRLEAFRRTEGLLAPEVQRLRQRHANQIAAAIRPKQREAVRAIDAALTALLEANTLERAFHAIVSGAPLVGCSFPGITTERIRFWRDHCVRNGMLPDPKATPAPKGLVERRVPRRSRANGAAEPAPALVAKGVD
jgi:hypothetical protein